MWRLVFIFLLPSVLSAQLKRFAFPENKMGSVFNIIFYCKDSAKAGSLAAHCYSIVDSMNRVYSDYDQTSESGSLVLQPAHVPRRISAELFRMISFSGIAWRKSRGAFDITMGNLSHLWRQANREKRFPSAKEINQAMQCSGFEKIVLDTLQSTILFKTPGMILDFGGIIKGYTAQRIIDFLNTEGIDHALADAGGDIVVSKAPPGRKAWSIGVNLPEKENSVWDKNLQLENCAVATSGDLYRYTLHNGKKYSHIIDPRSGYGVTSQRNVTVIAKDGRTADWLATACSILKISKAKKLCRMENASLLIAVLKDKKIKTYRSREFKNYFQVKEE